MLKTMLLDTINLGQDVATLNHLYDRLSGLVDDLFGMQKLQEAGKQNAIGSIVQTLEHNGIDCSSEEVEEFVMSMEGFFEALGNLVTKVIDGISSIGKKILNVFSSSSDSSKTVNSTSDGDVTKIINNREKTTKLPTFEDHKKILGAYQGILALFIKGAGKVELSHNITAPNIADIYKESSGQLFEFGLIEGDDVDDLEKELKSEDQAKRKEALAKLNSGTVDITWSRDAKHYFEILHIKPKSEATYEPIKYGLLQKISGAAKEGGENVMFDFDYETFSELEDKPLKELGYTSKEIILDSLAMLAKINGLYTKAAETDIIKKKMRDLEAALKPYLKVDPHDPTSSAVSKAKVQTAIRITKVYHNAFIKLCTYFHKYNVTFNNAHKVLFSKQEETEKKD